MTNVCGVCSHRERSAIDRQLVDGIAARAIARQYDLSRHAVDRHRRNHLPPMLVAETEARYADDAEALRAGVQELATLVPAAVGTLRSVMTDAAISPGVRLRAADSVLTRVLSLRELVDHDLRIAQLEAEADRIAQLEKRNQQ